MIEALHRDGVLDSPARDAALAWIRPEPRWRFRVETMLLLVGAAMILTGVICFFAFNWEDISPTVKLAILQGCVIGSAFAGWKLGPDKPGGAVSLICATVFTGVTLAVYGQIYQTGADSYELFMGWGLLTFGWVFISRFPIHWYVWLAIVHVAAVLAWDQIVDPGDIPYLLFIILTLFNGLLLALREYLVTKGFAWLAPRWTRLPLVVALLFFATLPAMGLSLDDMEVTRIMAILLYPLVLIAIYLQYRRRTPYVPLLVMATLSLAVVVTDFAVRRLIDISHGGGMFVVIGMVVLGIFTACALFLRSLVRSMETEQADRGGEV